MSIWKKVRLEGLNPSSAYAEVPTDASGRLSVLSKDYYQALGEGDISGHSAWSKL